MRNVAFATHVILGESRQKKGDHTVREVGRESRTQRQETESVERDQTQSGRISRRGERGDCDEQKTSFVRGSRHDREGESWTEEWSGRGQKETL